VAAPRWPVPVVLPSVALVAGFMPPADTGAHIGDMGAHITDMGDMEAHITAVDGDMAPALGP
jgi:hypothetical protein